MDSILLCFVWRDRIVLFYTPSEVFSKTVKKNIKIKNFLSEYKTRRKYYNLITVDNNIIINYFNLYGFEMSRVQLTVINLLLIYYKVLYISIYESRAVE